jgi:hypothetical protein
MEPLGELESTEKGLYHKVCTACKPLTLIPCSGCGYRMPCPHGVDIPGNLGAYNDDVVFDKPEAPRGCCAQCRDCDGRRPQQIPVGSWTPVVDSVLGSGKLLVTPLAHVP